MRRHFLGALTALALGACCTFAEPPAKDEAKESAPETPRESPDVSADSFQPECPELDEANQVKLFPCFELPPLFFQWGLEVLYWRVQPMEEVPLFTRGPGGIDGNGTLGFATTRVISNGFENDPSYQPGYRCRLGIATQTCGGIWGIEGSYFQIRPSNNHPELLTGEGITLARPVIDVTTDTESVQFVSAANQFSGIGLVLTETRFSGGDFSIGFAPEGHLYTWLGGVTILSLKERLDVGQSSDLLGGGLIGFNGETIAQPATVTLLDTFLTRNRFTGGHIGLSVHNTAAPPAHLEWYGKVAFGRTEQEVTINGSSTLSVPGQADRRAVGGLLALSSNIGTHEQSHASVVTETGLNIGCDVGPHRLLAGLSMIFWPNVVRPSSEVDRGINASFLPTSIAFGAGGGPSRPAPQFRAVDLLVFGFNVGFEFRY